MAASDPTTDVPTPTGTLQGVAAFSWDGSAWQPSSGRAGPSVATPTGVLRGVAAFNGGPAWQPSGQAQPGVATPTGVLDGVAVYTWSGAAWTPTGGTATPSTPSGALRGVAAFNWDGAAWQPAAQAGPSVATPYGVLDGVAMFGWSGSAWAAVGAPSLGLDFMQPGTLDARITFTRASTATYFDATGTIRTAATNAPRWDYDPTTHALRGLLIEEQRTNGLGYSGDMSQAAWAKSNFNGPAAPVVVANQTIAPDGTMTAASVAYPAVSGAGAGSVLGQAVGTAAAVYSLSIYLKGAVGGEQIYIMTTADGVTYYRATAVLTTSWQRISVVTSALTATTWYYQIGVDLRDASQTSKPAQTVYVWGAQMEQGAFVTSHIPTAATGVSRSADLASMPTAAWFTAASGTWQGEFIPNGVAAGLPIVISGNAGSPTIATGADGRLTAGVRSGAAVFSATGPLYTFGAVNKAAFGYLSGASTAAVNGTTIGPSATALSVTGTVVEFGSDGVTPGNNALNGWLRRVRYWPRVLSNAELQAVTT